MIYIIIYSIIIINAFFKGRFSNYILIILCLFSGLRYKTGLDYENYDVYFESLPKNIWNFEFGFHLISLVGYYFNIYHYLLISIIVFFLLYLTLRDIDKKIQSIFLIIFTYYGYWNVFSVLRQSIACVTFFYILIRWDKLSRRKKNILYVFAFSMHYSAFFFIIVIELIIPFILNRRKIQLLLVLLSIIFIQYKFDSSIFIPDPWKYALEITSLIKEVGFSLKYLEMVLVFFLSFYLFKDYFDRRLVAFVSVQIFFYALFSSISFLSERLNVYYDLVYALLFAKLLYTVISKFKERDKLYPVAVTFISIFIGIRYYQYIFMADYSEIPEWEITNKERFIPYQSIFNDENERKF